MIAVCSCIPTNLLFRRSPRTFGLTAPDFLSFPAQAYERPFTSVPISFLASLCLRERKKRGLIPLCFPASCSPWTRGSPSSRQTILLQSFDVFAALCCLPVPAVPAPSNRQPRVHFFLIKSLRLIGFVSKSCARCPCSGKGGNEGLCSCRDCWRTSP